MRRLMANAAAAAVLALAGGPVGADGQTYTWMGGDYLSSGLPSSLTSVDTLNISGWPGKVMVGMTLENQGVVNWRREPIAFDGSTVNNSGLWNATSASSLDNMSSARSVFNNTGVFRASSPSYTFTSVGIDFVNSGTVDVQSGFLVFGGNSNRFLDGTRVTGAGTAAIAGNASFSGRIHSANLMIGSGTSTGDNAKLDGTTVFAGGALVGTWELATDHQLLLAGMNQKSLNDATLTNGGTVILQGPSSLRLSASQIVNQGRFELQDDSSVRYGGGIRYSEFVNQGLLLKSGGAGISDLSQLYFSNTGTVDVRSGTLRLPDDFTNVSGVMQGVGTLASNHITNHGRVKPGEDGVGTLTIEGNFTNGSFGILDLGLGSGGSHGLLSIKGDLTVLGELSLSCVGDCSYAAGEQIEVLHYTGTRLGTFESLTLTGFGTGAFTTLYDDANHSVALLVTTTATAVVPEPDTWIMWLGGLGLGWLAARRRRH